MLLGGTVANAALVPPKPKPHRPVTLHPKPPGSLRLRRLPGAAAKTKPGTATDGSWLSYGHDDQLTNQVTSETIDAANAGSIALRWTAQLDSWMAASPVAATVDGATVVYAATEGGTLYAVDAATGATRWSRSVGTVETSGDCGTWGVSSTPAIDEQRGVIYVIGATGLLHAFDLGTGAEADGFPLALTLDRDLVEYVWAGLRIVGERVFAEVASYCDVPDTDGRAAEGRIIAVDLDTHAVSDAWDPVPGPDNLGALWGYGGLSVEPDGSALYTGVGNAWVHDATGTLQDDAGFGDKLVKLDPTTFHVLASNKPDGILTVGNDEDFGAAPVLFQPEGCPPLVAMNNKQGYLYVWNRDAIGDGPLMRMGISDGSAPFVGEPAWDASTSMLFDAEAKSPSGSTGVVGIAIDGRCDHKIVWETLVGAPPQPPPIVVNDVVFAAGGSAGISAMKSTDGTLLWHVATGSPALAPPIEVAGTLYASGGERLLAFSPKS